MTTVLRNGAAAGPIPSVQSWRELKVHVVTSAPADTGAIGVPVGVSGDVPGILGLDRAALKTVGFEGRLGQTLPIPQKNGPLHVAVGIGDATLDAAGLRDAAAAFAHAAGTQERLVVSLAGVTSVPPAAAAAAVVEGVVLARYRYDAHKPKAPGIVTELVLVTDNAALEQTKAGAERGRILAGAAELARDLANAPAGILTARRLAEIASAIARERGLGIEIFDEKQCAELECGGILAVNAGSVEPPRMIRLTYKPANSTGHLIFVGKGIMYDSGGINLKPTDDMHLLMKMDMSGAAAVLASMSALGGLGCTTAVTGYMMCTDNMPSGSAMKMGDIITIRGGTTIEVENTDAEGRLVMADALVLAAEAKPDAIVDIATLTGACLRALGDQIAGVLGNNQALVEQIEAAAEKTGESVWQLPLDRRYARQLDSEIAVMTNVGDATPAAITAALFLDHFVAGIPWAHIDIAGTMRSGSDNLWRPRGATGFGARLLADLAVNFSPPKA